MDIATRWWAFQGFAPGITLIPFRRVSGDYSYTINQIGDVGCKTSGRTRWFCEDRTRRDENGPGTSFVHIPKMVVDGTQTTIVNWLRARAWKLKRFSEGFESPEHPGTLHLVDLGLTDLEHGHERGFQLQVAMVYSTAELEPDFLYCKLDEDYFTWKSAPFPMPYTGHRPTRFERPWVI